MVYRVILPESSPTFGKLIGYCGRIHSGERRVYIQWSGPQYYDQSTLLDVFSLSADSDEHNESAHTHYHAVSNAWYDRYSKTLNWTEYGPTIDEATVEEMCQMGSGGLSKSASSESYTQDGEIYLKIISVESNQPWFEDYRMQGNSNGNQCHYFDP